MMLSDGNAEFAKAADVVWDLAGVGFGTRSKRFSFYAVDGTIKDANVEEDSTKCTVSDAKTLLAAI